MIDITHKASTLRKAIAGATVTVSSEMTMHLIREGRIPKGDIFSFSKVAGLFAVKKTSELIPDCHPLPVEFTDVRFELSGTEIHIEVEVHTIYKTGVEVEAMHGASVVALTLYDMLKPVDKGVEIRNIRLISKTGGKTDFLDKAMRPLKVTILVCSDSVAAGKKEDKAGKTISSKLTKFGVPTSAYEVIPDEIDLIRNRVLQCRDRGDDLLIITGGTGLSRRDVTPEAIRPLLDREIPGVMEAARAYGQQRTPHAMLSRGLAGMSGKLMILALPGSTKGAAESMDALFPHLLHVFRVAEGARHD